ncbi:hypothetical protein P152DRAFT_511691 [Eremomyces bilateralis CBS 781.70]|uniref:Uncharacterized protein n=1 Tax=Eremomyces bilateralis CBS 781.70 TaxID=1392243 RepID=A0A6G1GCB0_9PEZI|nr:uncharacterized protein P152DRAFT_511691 [Eremomyces bilateralis CBS 781.70]KAF1815556.1 hypothetical protein P152DRAFT_511691 [Eremomyces bilateralis CBS 781.70]
MCLVHVKEDRDLSPVRVTRVRRSTYRTASPRRISRVSVHSHHSDHHLDHRHSGHYHTPIPTTVAVPTAAPLKVPAPQPVPVFVKSPTPPPVHSHDVHYVHASPRSSVSSMRSPSPRRERDDYRYERREVRYERDVSPARSHRGGDYESFRYIDAPREERGADFSRGRSRSRSRVREEYHDPRDEYRRTRETEIHIDKHGNRRYYD